MKSLPLAALTLALVLAGCVTPPAVETTQVPTTSTTLGLDAARSSIADAKWWTAYGDPQLDRVMEQALAGNPTLAQAIARVKQARAAAEVANAGLSPQVGYDASVTRLRFSEKGIIPPPYGGTWQTQGQQGLNFSWDLDFWGEQAALVSQAKSQLVAAKLDSDAARQALSGAVMQAYIELDRSYALVDLATRTEAQRVKMLEITQQRVAAGLETKVELRQAEGAVPQARVELSQAQAQQARAVHLLSMLSAQGPNAYASFERPRLREDASLTLPAAVPADLLARRPDLLAARERVDAATSGQAAAKAQFFPNIDLTAFIGTSALGLGNLFRSASFAPNISPAIHLPIFDAGRLAANYKGATAEIDASVAGYNDAVLRAVRQVADQLTTIDATRVQLAEQQKALDAAEDAYRLAGDRYRAGLASFLTVLSAETQVLQQRRQRVDIAAARANARINLLLAVGGSFDPIGEKS